MWDAPLSASSLAELSAAAAAPPAPSGPAALDDDEDQQRAKAKATSACRSDSATTYWSLPGSTSAAKAMEYKNGLLYSAHVVATYTAPDSFCSRRAMKVVVKLVWLTEAPFTSIPIISSLGRASSAPTASGLRKKLSYDARSSSTVVEPKMLSISRAIVPKGN